MAAQPGLAAAPPAAVAQPAVAHPAAALAPLVLGPQVASVVAAVPGASGLLEPLALMLGVRTLQLTSFMYLRVPDTEEELLTLPTQEVVPKWRLFATALLTLKADGAVPPAGFPPSMVCLCVSCTCFTNCTSQSAYLLRRCSYSCLLLRLMLSPG